MSGNTHLPLTKNEIRFMSILALLSCFISSGSLIFILNRVLDIHPNNINYSKIAVIQGLILILCIFILPVSLESLRKYITCNHTNPDLPYLYRIVRHLFWVISILLLVSFLVVSSESNFLYIGLERVTEFEFLDSICYGFFIWILLGLVMFVIDKYAIKIENFWECDEIDTYLFINARTKQERLLSALILPLSVVSEEYLYRGYLVLYLGNVYNSFLLFGSISIILSIIAHLYQGKGQIISNLVFALVMVVVTIVSGRIFIATILHLLQNYLIMFTSWRIFNRKVRIQKS